MTTPTAVGFLYLVIGRGPSTLDRFGAVTMLGLGALLMFAALSPSTHGKGHPEIPIKFAERFILVIAALVMFGVAMDALFVL